MSIGDTMTVPRVRDLLAPDGSEVRVLLSLRRGGMSHFLLPAGQVSRAVRHRSVEEIWYILSGEGEMWRSNAGQEDITPLAGGTCLTIPAGTQFQFRATGHQPLAAVAITMPPWPGADEAVIVKGHWQPNLGADG